MKSTINGMLHLKELGTQQKFGIYWKIVWRENDVALQMLSRKRTEAAKLRADKKARKRQKEKQTMR